jgi:excisionase family DNA binding protein
MCKKELLEFIIERLDTIEKLLIKEQKPFLNIKAASEYLGISKNTLYTYTSKNAIPYYKLRGRRVYFKIDDLDNFILNKKNRYKSNDEIEMEASTRIVTGKKYNIR